MRRTRCTKIVATLGPASADADTIERLFLAGADVFRLNFSHGEHDDHRRRVDVLRTLEARHGRPIGILADLQGPKLRIGTFADGPVTLRAGDAFRLQLDPVPGSDRAVRLPHPEIFAALAPGAELLLDDGKLRLTEFLGLLTDHGDAQDLLDPFDLGLKGEDYVRLRHPSDGFVQLFPRRNHNHSLLSVAARYIACSVAAASAASRASYHSPLGWNML